MYPPVNEIISFFIGILLGAGVGYAIRNLLQISKEQKELEKQTINWVNEARDHINCRCSISYPKDETLEGEYDDKEII